MGMRRSLQEFATFFLPNAKCERISRKRKSIFFIFSFILNFVDFIKIDYSISSIYKFFPLPIQHILSVSLWIIHTIYEFDLNLNFLFILI